MFSTIKKSLMSLSKVITGNPSTSKKIVSIQAMRQEGMFDNLFNVGARSKKQLLGNDDYVMVDDNMLEPFHLVEWKDYREYRMFRKNGTVLVSPLYWKYYRQ